MFVLCVHGVHVLVDCVVPCLHCCTEARLEHLLYLNNTIHCIQLGLYIKYMEITCLHKKGNLTHFKKYQRQRPIRKTNYVEHDMLTSLQTEIHWRKTVA